MDAACEKIVCADRDVLAQEMLDTNVHLHTVRHNKAWVGSIDRRSHPGKWSGCAPATCRCENLCCPRIGCHLLIGLCAIFLYGAVQKRQRQPVIKKPKPAAH